MKNIFHSIYIHVFLIHPMRERAYRDSLAGVDLLEQHLTALLGHSKAFDPAHDFDDAQALEIALDARQLRRSVSPVQTLAGPEFRRIPWYFTAAAALGTLEFAGWYTAFGVPTLSLFTRATLSLGAAVATATAAHFAFRPGDAAPVSPLSRVGGHVGLLALTSTAVVLRWFAQQSSSGEWLLSFAFAVVVGASIYWTAMTGVLFLHRAQALSHQLDMASFQESERQAKLAHVESAMSQLRERLVAYEGYENLRTRLAATYRAERARWALPAPAQRIGRAE